MTEKQRLDDALKPFYTISQILRKGDSHSIESYLHICSAFISKYSLVFEDKESLTLLVSQINAAYHRRDFVSLADIFEFEITEYLKAEFSKLRNSDYSYLN